MKKTFQLHLRIENQVIENLRKQAGEIDVPLAELCRRRLRDSQQLTRIEKLLESLVGQMKGGERQMECPICGSSRIHQDKDSVRCLNCGSSPKDEGEESEEE